MLTAAQVSVHGGQGFLSVLLVGLLVVGSAVLALGVLFGSDDDE